MAITSVVRARLDAALAAGEAWSAKELFRSALSQNICGPEVARLYLRYGEFLLGVEDTVEAGKFLLLAGSEQEQHQAAIRLFVDEHSGSDLRWQFPAHERRRLAAYPETVRGLLARHGADLARMRWPLRPRWLVRDILGCLLALLLFGVCALGLRQWREWLS